MNNIMRKFRLLILTLVLALVTVSLSSCKNNLNYEICGLYVELVDVDNRSIDDNNPKIYFKKNDNNILSNKVGQVGKIVTFTDIYKTVDKENGKFTFSAQLNIPKETFENIKIRVIIFQNNKYLIDKKAYKTIKTTGNCRYSSNYTYRGEEYYVQFELKIVTRG